MRRSPLSLASCLSAARVAAALGMAVAGFAILAQPVKAAEPLAFTIPEEDGYGVADCMRSGNECGRAMATSWCEAHGHTHASAYGMADDVTGSTTGAPLPFSRAAVIIRCDD